MSYANTTNHECAKSTTAPRAPPLVGSGNRAVERWTVNRGDGGSIPPAAISFTPHLPVSFGRHTKSQWSLLSGVYARGSKRSHAGGKFVSCSGLTNSREKDNSCVSPSLGCLDINHLIPKTPFNITNLPNITHIKCVHCRVHSPLYRAPISMALSRSWPL